MNPITQNTQFLKQKAYELGFDYCGISKAAELTEDAFRLEKWLNKGYHGTMAYMANHFEKRIDPRKLIDGAKSVITLLINYYPNATQTSDTYLISKYAYGNDYHEIIKSKLNSILEACIQKFGSINARGFVDSAPVLERAWAVKSGLGWVGKNGNLITKKSGSFFFIATIITDIELNYDDTFAKDYCGSCTKCIDACPTNAILPNKEIEGRKCISYYTIELKEELIQSQKKWDNWIFGCDICQDVCPWNKFKHVNTNGSFEPNSLLLNYSKQEWEMINEESFKILFKNSPIKRSKIKGLKRNINFLKTSTQSNS